MIREPGDLPGRALLTGLRGRTRGPSCIVTLHPRRRAQRQEPIRRQPALPAARPRAPSSPPPSRATATWRCASPATRRSARREWTTIEEPLDLAARLPRRWPRSRYRRRRLPHGLGRQPHAARRRRRGDPRSRPTRWPRCCAERRAADRSSPTRSARACIRPPRSGCASATCWLREPARRRRRRPRRADGRRPAPPDQGHATLEVAPVTDLTKLRSAIGRARTRPPRPTRGVTRSADQAARAVSGGSRSWRCAWSRSPAAAAPRRRAGDLHVRRRSRRRRRRGERLPADP